MVRTRAQRARDEDPITEAEIAAARVRLTGRRPNMPDREGGWREFHAPEVIPVAGPARRWVHMQRFRRPPVEAPAQPWEPLPQPARANLPPEITQREHAQLDEIARLDERVAALEAAARRAVMKKRPYYTILGSTRTQELRRRLRENPLMDPREKANIEGMLEVNRRYKWWRIRHAPRV